MLPTAGDLVYEDGRLGFCIARRLGKGRHICKTWQNGISKYSEQVWKTGFIESM